MNGEVVVNVREAMQNLINNKVLVFNGVQKLWIDEGHVLRFENLDKKLNIPRAEFMAGDFKNGLWRVYG